MQDPVETSELLAFSRAVEAKSLSRAALELGVPRATIGRRLARLEERLGVRLLRRTTRSLLLTDAGESFYRHARVVLDAVDQAESSVRRSDGPIRGALRVSLPPTRPGTTDRGLATMITDFAAAHPEVRLQAHYASRFVDLVREGYDVAVRASSRLEPGLIARTLSRFPTVLVASPAYLAERGTPRSKVDLKHHRTLVGFRGGEIAETHWPLLDGGKIAVDGAFFSNDPLQLVEAAARGLGITLLPRMMVSELIDRGALVELLAGSVGSETALSIVYPEREFVPPQVRAFVDAVIAWAPRLIEPLVCPAQAQVKKKAKAKEGEKKTTQTKEKKKRPKDAKIVRRARR